MTMKLAVAATKTRKPKPPSLVMASIVVVVLMALVAIFAPLLAPYAPEQTNLRNILSGPTLAHPFGTDLMGRDTLSRLIYGAQLSLLAPLVVSILTLVLGTIIGLSSARIGGVFDLVVSRAMDIVFAFPSLLIALLAVVVFGPGLTAPIVALVLGYTPYMGRIVRAAALQEQVKPYVGAHKVLGFSEMWITIRHIFPNILPLLLAQATLVFGYSMIDLAALSYLGLGIQPPAADWGAMIAGSQSAVLRGDVWALLFPSAAVVVTVLAVNVIGEWVTDRFGGSQGGK